MNPYLYEKMLAEKRQDMLAEAERIRLIRQADAMKVCALQMKPTVRDRAMLLLARQIIRLGEYLTRRYGNPVASETSDQLCPEK